MKASLIDRSSYYRGLLVLIGRDRIIHPDEHRLMLQFGRMLDFDRRFCEAAIADLLDNEYINETPIHFDDPELAECFLRDAVRISLIDREIHDYERNWLNIVAKANNLSVDWLDNEYARIQQTPSPDTSPDSFEIYKYL